MSARSPSKRTSQTPPTVHVDRSHLACCHAVVQVSGRAVEKRVHKVRAADGRGHGQDCPQKGAQRLLSLRGHLRRDGRVSDLAYRWSPRPRQGAGKRQAFKSTWPHLADGRPAHVNFAGKVGHFVGRLCHQLGVELVKLAVAAEDVRDRPVGSLHANDKRVELDVGVPK